MKKMKYISKT